MHTYIYIYICILNILSKSCLLLYHRVLYIVHYTEYKNLEVLLHKLNDFLTINIALKKQIVTT